MSATPIVPFVVGVDRTAGTAQILVDDATRPALSADGNHVVYQRGDGIRVLSSDGTTTTDERIAELADATTGRSPLDLAARSLADLRECDRPGRRAARSDGNTRDPDRRPGRRDRPRGAPDRPAGGHPVGLGGRPPLVGGRGGRHDDNHHDHHDDDVPTVPTTPPTTPPATPPTTDEEVAALPTVPGTTVPATPIIPRFPSTGGSFPTAPATTVPRRSSSTTTSRTFEPVVPDVSPFASPVAFAPTVVDAGRRTAPVTLTNATTSTLRVSSVTVDVPGVFSLVTDACSGIAIAPAASCSVEVQFTPIAVGPAAGSAAFQLDDGSVVTAALSGEGVAAPTLDLLPAVAGAGQTVAVFGTGFPAGSTVELMQPGVVSAESVIVDADGNFVHVVVVLPRTPTGPALLTVNGQLDAFDEVSAELLVSTRGNASTDAALRSSAIGR